MKIVEQYDVVIANPPYVRTQVMGAKKAQALAKQFGLTGRVDLYHAFAIGMTTVLKPGGVLGLLTSNRFLTIKSGASLREMFSSHFDIEAIYDLGDTKLFTAAVLPVIIVARKGKTASWTAGRIPPDLRTSEWERGGCRPSGFDSVGPAGYAS